MKRGFWWIIACTLMGIVSAAWSQESTNSEVRMIQVPEAEWTRVNENLAEINKKLEKSEPKRDVPQTKLTGRFYLDAAAGSQNDDSANVLGDFTSGTKFRTARLGVKGSLYDMMEFESEFDFSGSKVVTKNVYGGFYNLPSGIDFRIGHFKEPWSMENLTSSRCTALMERSVLNSTKSICGGRNNGFMIHNWHEAEHWTWAAGLFTASMPENLTGTGDSDNFAFTARTTFLPFYEESSDGKLRLWHVGGSFSTRKFDRSSAVKNETSIKVTPDSAIAPATLNTSGTLSGLDSLNAFLIESSIINGPLSLDFEQAFFYLDDVYAGDAAIQSGYVQCSWMLTGESRNYKKSGGYFGDLTPDRPFVRTCKEGCGVFSGPGAWELAYRFGWIELDELACEHYDSAMKLGTAWNHTVGLNWYLSKYCRMMFNYTLSDTDYAGRYAGKHGEEHVFQTRFQVSF